MLGIVSSTCKHIISKGVGAANPLASTVRPVSAQVAPLSTLNGLTGAIRCHKCSKFQCCCTMEPKKYKVRFHSTSGSDECSSKMDDAKLRAKIDEYIKKEYEELDRITLDGTEPELEDVLERNKRWVEETTKKDPDFFPSLGRGQNPRYLYIGCSDARVDPAQLMGVTYGDLFVHRNVGNIVSGTDLNFLSVLEFSVDVLKVPHIIVCGHYDCGAVRGSIAQPKAGGLGLIENWIRNIRDVARVHKDELLAISDNEERHRKLVELNVIEQCFNVFKSACVQRRRMKTFIHEGSEYTLPRVHGLVFDPAEGILKKLPLNFKQELEDLRQIYELYQVPDWADKTRHSSLDHWEDFKS